MKRNRKREPLRFGTVAKSLGACVCIAVIGLGYVWQKTQIYRLGDDIKKREATLLATQKRNSMLAAQLAHLKSPAQLEARCQQQGVALVAPREDQVVRLYEPGPEWDALATIPAQFHPKQNGQPKAVAQR
ncbi:MAG: hypothetical protein ACREXT_20375 [Gammaproteobacteria bacterium]